MKSAPGYRSWAWTTQDWRVVVPLVHGGVDYSERCGAPSNRTSTGHVRLCLPFAVIAELVDTSEGREILHRQGTMKQRAPAGARVPWHPRIAELWRELEAHTPADHRNPQLPLLGQPWVRALRVFARREGLSLHPCAKCGHPAVMEVLGDHSDVLYRDLLDAARRVLG